jgi:hypothetical protein
MSTGFPAANAPALAAATAQLWLRDELAYAWRAAQNEAVAAYEAWRATRGATHTPCTPPRRTAPTAPKTCWRESREVRTPM